MSGFSNDLQEFQLGLLHVFEGVTQLEQTTRAFLQKVEPCADHLITPCFTSIAATGERAARRAE